jgi:membrane-associated phospholipid phosphatase
MADKFKIRVFALLIFTALAVVVSYYTIDLPIAIYCKHDLPPTIKQLAEYISDSGNLLLVALVIAALIGKYRFKSDRLLRMFLFPAICSLLAGLVANILKPIFGRWRPKAYFEMDGAYGFEPFSGMGYIHASFPSGHSLSIMGMMAGFAICFPKWRIPCFLFAGIIGLSRVLLKAHYVSDVLGGLALGYIFAHCLQRLLVKRNVGLMTCPQDTPPLLARISSALLLGKGDLAR